MDVLSLQSPFQVSQQSLSPDFLLSIWLAVNKAHWWKTSLYNLSPKERAHPGKLVFPPSDPREVHPESACDQKKTVGNGLIILCCQENVKSNKYSVCKLRRIVAFASLYCFAEKTHNSLLIKEKMECKKFWWQKMFLLDLESDVRWQW